MVGNAPRSTQDNAAGQQGIRTSEHRIRVLEQQLAARLTARHQRSAPRNVNHQFKASFSPLDQIALLITTRVGTFGFFLVIFSWTVLWLGWNVVTPRPLHFDHAPAFVLWLFISNMIQLMLLPLIMVGQNLLGRHTELRAESDFAINQKAEQEIETILLHLEWQAAILARQEQLILRLLGGDATPSVAKATAYPYPE